MEEIRTELDVDAAPARLWRVITDFARYPEWNPFLTVGGTPTVGAPVDVFVKAMGFLPVTFHTTVIIADANRELRWRGHFINDNVVAAEHYFIIQQLDGQRSRFIHGEQFTGRGAGIAWAIIRRETSRGYARMNAAFKQRVESGAGA